MTFFKNYLSLVLAMILLTGMTLETTANDMVGQSAPEISLPDRSGLNQNLSALRGNITLVVFWRSGDPNSRINNSSLHIVYDKYKSLAFQNAPRGFEIYSISTDGNEKEWLDAIAKDRLPGMAVRDVYGSYLDDYKVTHMPATYLVDGNGMIISSNLNYASLDQTLASRVSGNKQSAIEYTADFGGTAVRSAPVVDYLTYKAMQQSSQPALQYVSTSSAPQPATTAMATYAAPTTTTVSTAITYRIQLGAYQHPQLDQFSSLASLGSIYTEKTSVGISRVLLGDFATTDAAVRTLSQLQQSGYIDAFVVIYKGSDRQRVMSKAEVMQTATAIGVNIIETPIVAEQPVHIPDLGGHASVAIPASSGTGIATHSTTTDGLTGYVVVSGSSAPTTTGYQNVNDVHVRPAEYGTGMAVTTTTTTGVQPDGVIAFHSGNSAPFIKDGTHSRGHAVTTSGGTTYYDQSLYPTATRTGSDLATGGGISTYSTTTSSSSGSNYYSTGGQPYTSGRTKVRGAATTGTSTHSYTGTTVAGGSTSRPYTSSGKPRTKSVNGRGSQITNMSDTQTVVQVLPEDCICPTVEEKRTKLEKEEADRQNGMLSRAVDDALGRYTSVTTGEVLTKRAPAASGRLASKEKREKRKEKRRKRRSGR